MWVTIPRRTADQEHFGNNCISIKNRRTVASRNMHQRYVRMKPLRLALFGTSALLVSAAVSLGEIRTVVDHNDNAHVTAGFKFKDVPPPSRSDGASRAKFTIVDGAKDNHSGGVAKLQDGRLPTEEDQPAGNFFFNAGTDGGRILADLGSAIRIKQVNTYSWHADTRGPQVYKLYASDGSADGFNTQPRKPTDPEKCGWKLVARVDTRPKAGESGGQYGVSISDPNGTMGTYRYILFDCSQTEADDAFGNTFYSEIDILAKDDAALAGTDTVEVPYVPYVARTADGKCRITIDTSAAPDLQEWATNKLAPVLAEWYPKVVALLPSEGYVAPTNFSVMIRPGSGVAATGGTRITANASWLKRELDREAIGALVHEMVHVVQQYGRAPRGATRPPGWLTEGITDYIRWFLYEPQSHGADLTWMRRQRNFSPRYDASYRPTANFLNWISEKYDKNILQHLNAAIREGKYSGEVWRTYTGKTAQELGEEWKKEIEEKLGTVATNVVPSTAESRPAQRQ